MNDTKQQAAGKWPSILGAYIPTEFLTGKHTACPLCGGVDRFRFDDKGGGSYFCSHCGAGTGIHLLAQFHDVSYSEAWKLVEKVIGSAVVVEKKQEVDQLARVKNILKKCAPSIKGDFVHDYLASRSLPNVPESILAGYYSLDNILTSCMVCKVSKGAKLVGLHVTFIRDGKKIMRKMYAIAPKSLAGGAIRLNRLEGGNHIVIGEGVETSLSAGIITGLPAWSCMDAGNLEAVQIPDQITHVVIAGDADASYTGQKSAFTLAKRLKEQGKIIQVLIPDIIGTDFNDVLKNDRS